MTTDTERESHWQSVYASKSEQEVSWFEKSPALSLSIIGQFWGEKPAQVIDIGGGASRLVDALIGRPETKVSVLDISPSALETARNRIGPRAVSVEWIAADVTRWRPSRRYDVWHDRAALHFLTQPADQAAYVAALDDALRPDGIAIIGTFAPDGPEKCSGLPVCRHDATSLSAMLGATFELIDARRHMHVTPWGSEQRFQFSTIRRK